VVDVEDPEDPCYTPAMGRNRIFVPQDVLDAWVADQRATISGSELQVADGTFEIAPAVLFMADVSDTGDPHGLLGRVKEKAQLDALGAENYMGSVVLGDSAYEVKDGFVGIPRIRGRTPTGAEAGAGGTDIDTAAGGAAGETTPSDEALLTKFLLENL
jgi:hypothetical protein